MWPPSTESPPSPLPIPQPYCSSHQFAPHTTLSSLSNLLFPTSNHQDSTNIDDKVSPNMVVANGTLQHVRDQTHSWLSPGIDPSLPTTLVSGESLISISNLWCRGLDNFWDSWIFSAKGWHPHSYRGGCQPGHWDGGKLLQTMHAWPSPVKVTLWI